MFIFFFLFFFYFWTVNWTVPNNFLPQKVNATWGGKKIRKENHKKYELCFFWVLFSHLYPSLHQQYCHPTSSSSSSLSPASSTQTSPFIIFGFVSANLCGAEKSRTPYLTKGSLAVICTAAKCPGNSKCLFSKIAKDYICCVTKQSKQKNTKQMSTAATATASESTMMMSTSITARCPGGHTPLMFPATKQPLQCKEPKLQCPKNYTCINRVCCPESLRYHKKDAALKCPRHLVKVFFTRNGRRFSRCGKYKIKFSAIKITHKIQRFTQVPNIL